jgi:hypothetical protein
VLQGLRALIQQSRPAELNYCGFMLIAPAVHVAVMRLNTEWDSFR